VDRHRREVNHRLFPGAHRACSGGMPFGSRVRPDPRV
jgi:hypothetical protein